MLVHGAARGRNVQCSVQLAVKSLAKQQPQRLQDLQGTASGALLPAAMPCPLGV